MTKEVLLTISGLHYDVFTGPEDEENEPIEVITPATYYYKNRRHYILYEEVVEGFPGTIKNKIRISETGMLEIMKSGLSNLHMVFEKDKINMTQYDTPYGEILVGVYTKDMRVDVSEEEMDIRISYILDINGEKVADSEISMSVRSKQE
ncbi:MAG TPA: DUF1934 domain-containing protein [Candidatus Dorea gallistercoris]|uniref:DUF1934 domain-containing protein n=1 Tax=Candidatus Dorea gallistercoris TaxID=2838542 RepID=A0A9D1UD27_9FIRM|nr:DUF1934 domain-containing protein [Candidatus Dorea gallistercoris]